MSQPQEQPALLPIEEIDGGLIEGSPGQLFITLQGDHLRIAQEQAEQINRQRFEAAKGNPDAEYQPPATSFDVVKTVLNQMFSSIHHRQQQAQAEQAAAQAAQEAAAQAAQDPPPPGQPDNAIPLQP